MKRKIVTKLMAIVLAGVLLTGSVTPGFHMSRVQAAEDLFNTRYDFNFEDGIEGWYYGEGWEYQYNGAKPTLESDTENGRMKIAVDFSQDADKNWSNIAACWKSEEDIDLSGVTQISMDIWYETEKLTEGELKLAFYSNCGIDVNTSLINVQEEEGTGLTKARAVFGFPAIGSDAVTDLAVKIVGCNTGYSGAVWIDNIQFEAKDSETGDESEQPDTSVDSTLAANSGNPVSSNGSALTVVKRMEHQNQKNMLHRFQLQIHLQQERQWHFISIFRQWERQTASSMGTRMIHGIRPEVQNFLIQTLMM